MEIILGATVSLIVQFLKNRFGTSSWETIVSVLALSVLSAGAYTALVHTGMWETVVQVFVTAGAFYTYVIQRFE